MAVRTSADTAAAIGSTFLRRLPWDSNHFGFEVSEISSPTIGDENLAAALCFARESNHRLVYWTTEPGRNLPAWVARFGATAVNHRVQYSMDMLSNHARSRDASVPDETFHVVTYPPGPACRVLEELAILSGAYSRFHVDPRIPADRFESLYRIWVNRSTRRELADRVLVATVASEIVVGFITVSWRGSNGHVGLLAVHPACQGRGIGSRLMKEAQDLLKAQSVKTVTVVTQLENVPACRLYSRWNYTPVEISASFHFWPDPPARWPNPGMPGAQT